MKADRSAQTELAAERRPERSLSGAGKELFSCVPRRQRQHHGQGYARRAGDHAHVPGAGCGWPNDMSLLAKVGHWFHQIGKFVLR